MAEGIMKKLLENAGLNEDFEVNSAGTMVFVNFGASQNAILATSEIGIDITSHRSRQLTNELILETDIILTMTNEQKRLIGEAFEIAALKTFTLGEYAMGSLGDIEDPIEGDMDVYCYCRDEIVNYIIEIVNRIRKDK